MIAVLIAGAVATLISLFGTRFLIVFFQDRGRGQPILGKEDHGPEHHMIKQGTPTMGGIAIVIAAFVGWVAAHVRNIAFSALSVRSRRCAACSLICVRMILSKRLLSSHGFSKKSVAPSCIAFTATPIVPHPVMAMMGRFSSSSRNAPISARPSWPEVVSRT